MDGPAGRPAISPAVPLLSTGLENGASLLPLHTFSQSPRAPLLSHRLPVEPSSTRPSHRAPPSDSLASVSLGYHRKARPRRRPPHHLQPSSATPPVRQPTTPSSPPSTVRRCSSLRPSLVFAGPVAAPSHPRLHRLAIQFRGLYTNSIS